MAYAVVTTEDVLGEKPRLVGHRLSVLQVAELVLDRDADPVDVAGQFDISLAEVHEALAYYYTHVDEMETSRRRREELVEDLRSESRAPDAIER